MTATEAAPPRARETADGDPHTGRRTRALAVVAVSVLLAGGAAWGWLTTPQLEGGGLAGVRSEDHEVLLGRGTHETAFVVPADGDGSTTIALGLRNAGRVPVELVDVWPNEDAPTCIWQPSQRWFQDDPRHVGDLDERARPVAGAVLAPGGSATVWVTGAQPDPDGCVHEAISSHADVEVIARIGGRISTTRVPLGYTFGYADEPDLLRDFYDVEVVRPTEPDPRD